MSRHKGLGFDPDDPELALGARAFGPQIWSVASRKFLLALLWLPVPR